MEVYRIENSSDSLSHMLLIGTAGSGPSYLLSLSLKTLHYITH